MTVFSPKETQCHLQAQFLVLKRNKLCHSKKLQKDAVFEAVLKIIWNLKSKLFSYIVLKISLVITGGTYFKSKDAIFDVKNA